MTACPCPKIRRAAALLAGTIAGVGVAIRPAAAGGQRTHAAPRRAAPSAAASHKAVFGILPVGEFPVDVLGMVGSPRLMELSRRWGQSIGHDPKWVFEYIRRNAREGEPLPYDPRFGLSQAEWSEMLRLMDETKMVKVATATLTIRDEGNGQYRLQGGQALPDLTDIVIDTAHNGVSVPEFGETQTREAVEPNSGQKTGPWRGTLWHAESFDPATTSGYTLTVGIGRMQGTGRRGLLYVQGNRARNGAAVAQVMRVITFDMPAVKDGGRP